MKNKVKEELVAKKLKNEKADVGGEISNEYRQIPASSGFYLMKN